MHKNWHKNATLDIKSFVCNEQFANMSIQLKSNHNILCTLLTGLVGSRLISLKICREQQASLNQMLLLVIFWCSHKMAYHNVQITMFKLAIELKSLSTIFILTLLFQSPMLSKLVKIGPDQIKLTLVAYKILLQRHGVCKIVSTWYYAGHF